MRELQKICGCLLRQPKSEDDDDDKEVVGWGDQIIIILVMAKPAAVIAVIHGYPIAAHFTFFPTFPFFFPFFFLLLLPFFSLGLSWAQQLPCRWKEKARQERSPDTGSEWTARVTP